MRTDGNKELKRIYSLTVFLLFDSFKKTSFIVGTVKTGRGMRSLYTSPGQKHDPDERPFPCMRFSSETKEADRPAGSLKYAAVSSFISRNRKQTFPSCTFTQRRLSLTQLVVRKHKGARETRRAGKKEKKNSGKKKKKRESKRGQDGRSATDKVYRGPRVLKSVL